MPTLKVLLDSKGKLAGTAQDAEGAGPEDSSSGRAPRATLVAGPGQKVVELQISAAEARMDAEALHQVLTTKRISGR